MGSETIFLNEWMTPLTIVWLWNADWLQNCKFLFIDPYRSGLRTVSSTVCRVEYTKDNVRQTRQLIVQAAQCVASNLCSAMCTSAMTVAQSPMDG
jgi:hypothetical protein